MPRYYFDCIDIFGFRRDEEGENVPCLDTACKTALQCLMSMLEAGLSRGADQLNFRVDVRDGANQVVYTASLALSSQRLGQDRSTD